MSVTTVTHLRCDWRACRAALHVHTADPMTIRAEARDAGWTQVRVPTGRWLDRCPKHPAKPPRKDPA